MEPTNEQIAWLAGLFEGEGCVIIRKNRYGVYYELTVKMTDEDVIRRIHEWFGGRLRGPYGSKVLRYNGDLRKPTWQWVISTKQEVLNISKALRPWMGTRRNERLDIIIADLEMREYLGPGYKRTKEHNQLMSEMKMGYSHTDETRKKMSESAKKRWENARLDSE